MEYVKTEFDDLCILDEERTKGGRMEKRKHIDSDDEDDKYKSKNLEAERRRHKKLYDRLFTIQTKKYAKHPTNEVGGPYTVIEVIVPRAYELVDKVANPLNTLGIDRIHGGQQTHKELAQLEEKPMMRLRSNMIDKAIHAFTCSSS
ncbi:Hypothetical predicted protein [Olea europaea subsp. europaea]|uniref:Uncharacterized protein n=1 Tax=Olea europaea subsp. europaea TaxID=158383 RepID=A0A8S0TXM2_OLEEU|nr:Hypothetical predicted protein [Olea europaea subsp. europaea]